MNVLRWWRWALGHTLYKLGKRLMGVDYALAEIYIPGRGTFRL